MTEHAVLIRQIESLPHEYLGEVIDFVAQLKRRKLEQVPETMLLSEATLAREWDSDEEDRAWDAL